MPRLISAPFFDATPVFSRAEYATAVGQVSGDKVGIEMLTQHLEAGNIKRVACGLLKQITQGGLCCLFIYHHKKATASTA